MLFAKRFGIELQRIGVKWNQHKRQTRCTSPCKGEVGEQSEHRKSGLPDLRT